MLTFLSATIAVTFFAADMPFAGYCWLGTTAVSAAFQPMVAPT